MPGQMVHIEIPADDPAAGCAFWGGLFGWQFDQYPGAGPGEYHMARFSETSGGAVTNMEPGKRGPRVYFDVDDIDVGVARVGELGGQAGEKMPVPGMGWFAICTDPHGNDFGIWQTDENAPVAEG
jgi:predicted enzyme related to lactoylglutathione lyase